MQRIPIIAIAAAALVIGSAGASHAQQERRRSPDGAGAPQPLPSGTPRDPKFPYAGLWKGNRTMPVGGDEVVFRFTVADGKYSGVMIHPNGGKAPDENLTASAAGLTWESPNSGGGTWVYKVRLAGPDSMVGTLVLRDAPPNFPPPAPSGTLVLKRQ